MTKYRVRFAPEKDFAKPLGSQGALKEKPESYQKRHYKSRYGCRECKSSRLKCDETYPVCLRCSRRGIVCHAAAREQQWQIELPGFTLNPGDGGSTIQSNSGFFFRNDAGKHLLQYWLEKTSRILVPSEDDNPFAYPIVDHLSISQSLLHTINSISLAHQHFFHASHMHESLKERIIAIELLRKELGTGSQPLHTLFFSIYLLGISSSMLDDELQDFGQEHLQAARVIIDLLLAEEVSRKHPLTRFIVGTFVYWDMSCAFLIKPDSCPIHDLGSDLFDFITGGMSGFSHPTNGPCTELFFVLSTLGRYIRYIMAHGIRDSHFELELESRLLTWKCPDPHSQPMWSHTAEAFRKHGLLMLYRHCYHDAVDDLLDPGSTTDMWPAWQNSIFNINELTRRYAIDIVISLSNIPITSSYLALQGIPLLTAGSELTAEDVYFHNESKSRLLALYSCSRIPANLVAVNLLENIWQSRMEGGSATWLQIIVQNDMKLRIG